MAVKISHSRKWGKVNYNGNLLIYNCGKQIEHLWDCLNCCSLLKKSLLLARYKRNLLCDWWTLGEDLLPMQQLSLPVLFAGSGPQRTPLVFLYQGCSIQLWIWKDYCSLGKELPFIFAGSGAPKSCPGGTPQYKGWMASSPALKE